jgi:RNA polymerase sigma-70 factor, ECF subfamily
VSSEPAWSNETSDADLLDLAATNREAFAALFQRHQASVYRFAKQMTGSKEAAEDLTQEVFIALIQHGDHYDPGLGSLTTYLYGIVRNLVRRRHKRHRSRPEVDMTQVEDDSPALATARDPIDELARAEQRLALRRAILLLPMHYREVIVLCELNGLSYDQAARIVGRPVGTIRSRLIRARSLLIARCRSLLSEKAVEGKRGGARAWSLLLTTGFKTSASPIRPSTSSGRTE